MPTAPRRMGASPEESRRRPGERSSRTDTTMAAISAKPISSGVCQPPAAARKLNAAPLLNASTRLKNGVISSRSQGTKRPRTIHFVTWSASTMASETKKYGNALDIAARLAWAVQVALAAPAQPLAVDIRHVMPAALALWMLARPGLHCGPARAVHPHGRSDKQVLELGAEAREQLV